LRAYVALRELNGWKTVEIERTVVLDELEVAGTFDRIDLIPGLAALLGPGTCQHDDEPDHVHDATAYEHGELPVVVDVKTEKDPTLNGLHIGPQLAIYSRARRMWRPTGGTHDLYRNGVLQTYPSGDPVQVPNGEYVAAPCVRQDVAVVVHIFDGDANPLLLNLAEGWAAAQAAYEQIQRKARAKRKVGAAGAWFAPLPAQKASRLTTFVETAAAARYADPDRPGPGLVAVAEHMAAGGSTTEGVGAALLAGADAETASVRMYGPATYAASGVEIVGGHGSMPSVVAAPPPSDEDDPLAETRKQLIAAIWQARTLDGLAILWNMANDRGVKWIGPVAMAGDARRRQIECVQRAMHVPGTVKCACGWMAGQVA
jgi:hypothetical protein